MAAAPARYFLGLTATPRRRDGNHPFGEMQLGPAWYRLDSSVRATDEDFTLPPALAGGDGALIYFSLGSLGSADTGLMRRVISCLAATPHRYIVSKGPLHAEIELAPNMWGAEFVPQASILPLADLSSRTAATTPRPNACTSASRR